MIIKFSIQSQGKLKGGNLERIEIIYKFKRNCISCICYKGNWEQICMLFNKGKMRIYYIYVEFYMEIYFMFFSFENIRKYNLDLQLEKRRYQYVYGRGIYRKEDFILMVKVIKSLDWFGFNRVDFVFFKFIFLYKLNFFKYTYCNIKN